MSSMAIEAGMPPDPHQLPDEAVEYKRRLEHWDKLGWTSRVSQMDDLVNNRWRSVFPSDVGDYPNVANIFREHIEDLGHLFAAARPTIRRDTSSSDRDMVKAAERTERVIVGYHYGSRLYDNLESLGMDVAATGINAIKVWPNFGVPEDRRFPVMKRLEIRNGGVLPEPLWNPDQPSDNVMVCYKDTVARLSVAYPDAMGTMMARMAETRGEYDQAARGQLGRAGQASLLPAVPDEMIVVDTYSSEECVRMVYCPSDDRYPEDAQIVTAIDNPTEFCPVQLTSRSAWSLEPSGQMDDIKGIVRFKQRALRLAMDYLIEMIYGGKLVWNVANAQLRGPFVRYQALSPDAFMKPITAENMSFQFFQMLGMAENEARGAAMAPESRQGQVDLNKATAAFLTKSQGQLASVVESMQSRFAAKLEILNETALEQDEKMCDTFKTIKGRARGRRFSTSYKPSATIAGDYANTVSYPQASGLNVQERHFIAQQSIASGTLSVETAVDNSIFTDDTAGELARIRSDALDRAVLLRLQTDATQPQSELDLPTLVSVARLIRQDDKDMVDVLEELARRTQAAQPILQPGGEPTAQPPTGAPEGGQPAGNSGTAGVPSAAPAQPSLPSPAAMRSLGRR